MHDTEAPHAIFFDGFILVNRSTHRGAITQVHLLQHAQADLGTVAIGCHMDDRLHLNVVAQSPDDRTFFTATKHFDQEVTQARTFVDTALSQFDAAFGRKQVSQIGPQVFVEVIAVGALEVFQLMKVLGASHQTLGLRHCCRNVCNCLSLDRSRREQRRRSDSGTRTTHLRIDSRRTGHRIAVVIRRHMRLGIDGINLGRRPVGWQRSQHARCSLRILGPTLVIVAAEGRVVMDGLELPDATFVDVSIFVNAFAPLTTLTVCAGHRQFAATRPRRLAIGRNRHHRLQLQMVVKPAGHQPMRA